MRPIVFIAAVFAFYVGGAATLAVVRCVGKGSPELALMVGAALGTQVAAVIHCRSRGAGKSFRVKAVLASILALSAVFFGIVLHTVFGAFVYPEVSIPIAVIVTFGFPFILFDTTCNALLRKRDA